LSTGSSSEEGAERDIFSCDKMMTRVLKPATSKP
jgi:hypothetical protein